MSATADDIVVTNAAAGAGLSAVETAPSLIPQQRSSRGAASGLADAMEAAHAAAPAFAGDRTFSRWLRAWGLHAEVMAAFAVGAVVAFTLDRSPYVPLVVLFVWMFANFKSGRAVTTPAPRQFQSVVRSTLL